MGSPRDYKNTIVPNWCPGCGDFGIQNAIAAVCAAKGWPNEDIVLISGIGCSSRLPYYVNTYGFHTIHGRAAAVATGAKVANPDLTIWQISGDGDGLAIGDDGLGCGQATGGCQHQAQRAQRAAPARRLRVRMGERYF